MAQPATGTRPACPRKSDAQPSVQARQEPVVRIHILGEMQATTCFGRDVLPRGRKARAILGLICLAGGEPIKRDDLAARLWDRVSRTQGLASFRQALRELTGALGEAANEVIVADRETIRLNVAACWVDALALTEPALGAIRHELAKHCTGELLTGLDAVSASFGRWVVAARANFREKLRHLLDEETTGDKAPDSSAGARADIARRLITFGPAYEGALRVLMRSLADLGEPELALAEFDNLTLAQAAPETRALYEAIRSGASVRNGLDLSPVVSPKTAGSLEAPQTRNRRRVAVLPFTDDARHEDAAALHYSVEVASELGRYRWFDVVAPMGFRGGRPSRVRPGAQERADEVDFVIDGLVSNVTEGQQISVRLLDLTNYTAPVWTREVAPQGVGRLITDIVQMIDPVSLLIDGKLRPLAQTRGQRLANELLLKAIPLMYSMERGPYEQAGRHLRDAMEEDPKNARAAAWAAYWHVFNVGQGWAVDRMAEFELAKALADRAIRIDANNAEALGISGHIIAFLSHDFDEAMRRFDRALRINPNMPHVNALSAPTCCYVGKAALALERLRRYRELAPYDPYFPLFETMYTMTYVFLRDWKRAADVGRRSVANNPRFSNGYKPLIAALGNLQLRAEAQSYIATLCGELEKDFTIRKFIGEYPFGRDSDRQSYVHGLRLAGVPEG